MTTGFASREKDLQTAQVSDLCRRRLLNYADTFYELARSYTKEFNPEQGDRQNLLTERRLWENRQVIRCHLTEMARIMTEVACEVMCYRPMEERKKRLIVQAMRQEGVRVENPCYVSQEDGRTEIVLTMSAIKRDGISAEEVADMISVLLDKRLKLSISSPYVVEKEPHSFILEEETEFLVLTGFSRATKESETVSGDNYVVMETEKGKLTVMLSDGTGSGEKAGKDSERVLDLMEKMLEAGYSDETAIDMVNTALFAAGEDQNHPTLDICDIDLYRGNCELRKVGGAVTFLKRAGEVEPLAAGSLPLGIFQKVEAAPIRKRLRDGDYLIMVSDGVVDAFGEEDYRTMCSFLAGIAEQNPGEIAEKLLRAALCAGGGRIQDDMTVGVIGIWETMNSSI
ncbi:MAG: SpoIIE family protein phosphatase [Acetatifactor sp.]